MSDSPLTRHPLGAHERRVSSTTRLLTLALVVLALPKALTAESWVVSTKTAEREAAEFRVTVLGNQYLVKANGSVAGVGGRSFDLPVERGDFIERLYALGTGDRVTFAYESENDETSICRLVSVSLPSSERRWETRVVSVNLGIPGVSNGFAYVTAYGFVGKLDLATGHWTWKQEDLIKRFKRFESFDQPVVQHGFVTCAEDNPEAFGHKDRARLVLDDNTGEILEPKPTGGA